MSCKGLTFLKNSCNKKCINNTDFCIVHYYMSTYTTEMLNNLTLCNCCFKFKYISDEVEDNNQYNNTLNNNDKDNKRFDNNILNNKCFESNDKDNSSFDNNISNNNSLDNNISNNNSFDNNISNNNSFDNNISDNNSFDNKNLDNKSFDNNISDNNKLNNNISDNNKLNNNISDNNSFDNNDNKNNKCFNDNNILDNESFDNKISLLHYNDNKEFSKKNVKKQKNYANRHGTYCDSCIENNFIFDKCSAEKCRNKKSDINEYCFQHQIYITIQKSLEENKKLCANFIKKQCTNLLDIGNEFKSCLPCRLETKNRKECVNGNYCNIIRCNIKNSDINMLKRCTACGSKRPQHQFVSFKNDFLTTTCQLCRDKRSDRYYTLKRKYI